MIWRRYTFDRQLRLLVMDAIERVEIAFRTQLTNIFTLKYGAFGHLKNNNLPRIDNIRWTELIQKIRTKLNIAENALLIIIRTNISARRIYPYGWLWN